MSKTITTDQLEKYRMLRYTTQDATAFFYLLLLFIHASINDLVEHGIQ